MSSFLCQSTNKLYLVLRFCLFEDEQLLLGILNAASPASADTYNPEFLAGALLENQGWGLKPYAGGMNPGAVYP